MRNAASSKSFHVRDEKPTRHLIRRCPVRDPTPTGAPEIPQNENRYRSPAVPKEPAPHAARRGAPARARDVPLQLAEWDQPQPHRGQREARGLRAARPSGLDRVEAGTHEAREPRLLRIEVTKAVDADKNFFVFVREAWRQRQHNPKIGN